MPISIHNLTPETLEVWITEVGDDCTANQVINLGAIVGIGIHRTPQQIDGDCPSSGAWKVDVEYGSFMFSYFFAQYSDAMDAYISFKSALVAYQNRYNIHGLIEEAQDG